MECMNTSPFRPTTAPITRMRFAGAGATPVGGVFGGRGVPIPPVSRFTQEDTY
jgi:hypothetical protein